MGRLINDVLDFARGRLGGGLVAARRPSDLSAALPPVVRELQVAHPDRVIESDIVVGGLVNCDPDRIAQLASNLLANGLAHGDPNVPVRIKAMIEGKTFVLSVRNGGVLTPEVKAGLFRPFSRRHSGEIRDGLGLGLYISQEIAIAHDGTLSATSGQGHIQFELRIPVV